MHHWNLYISYLILVLGIVAIIFRNYSKSNNKVLFSIIFVVPAILLGAQMIFVISIDKNDFASIEQLLLLFNLISLFAILSLNIYYILKERGRSRLILLYFSFMVVCIPFVSTVLNLVLIIKFQVTKDPNFGGIDIFEDIKWLAVNFVMAIITGFLSGILVESSKEQ